MLLYLVQHGEAKSEAEDPERGLSETGIHDVRKVAAYAGKIGIKPVQIFHSSKARAQQTARILAEQLKPGKGISLSDNLLPLDDPGLWALRLAGMTEDILLAGHLPHLGRLAASLLCGNREQSLVAFKMAGIVCLKRFDEGYWAVNWMIVPEIIS